MATLDVESVDLATLVAAIKASSDAPIEGAVVGRTRMRDVVSGNLGCSELEAEQLVDTLVARGFVHLEQAEDGREVWLLSAGT